MVATFANQMTAMSSAYAAAYQQGVQFWMQQAQLWRSAASPAAIWPLAADFSRFEQTAREIADSFSLQVFEAEDMVAFRLTLLDMRIDMMIAQAPETGDVAEAAEWPASNILPKRGA